MERIAKYFMAATVVALVLSAAYGRDMQSAQLLPPNQGRRISVPFEALRPGANEIRVRVANLINNRYGEIAESGLLGPVR